VLAQITQQLLGPRGVVKEVDDEGGRPVAVRRERHHLEPDVAAVFRVRRDAEIRAHALAAANGDGTTGAADRMSSLIESREDFPTRTAAYFSGTETEHRFGRGIPEHDAAIGGRHPYTVFGAREACAQPFRQ